MTAIIAGYEVNLRRHIGRGAIGTVYRAKNKDGITIAAKQVDKTRSERNAVREIQSAQKHAKLSHENIVKIFEIYNEEDIWVFMEYLADGDLNCYALNQFKQFDNIHVKINLMIQICKGLCFLHNLKICHRDIKPQNILIQSKDDSELVNAKLTDFGIARFPDPNDSTSAMHTKIGTQNYMAPDFFIPVSDGKPKYHKSVDIFAFGLTKLAILQAKEGKNLKPIAEGCKPSESLLAIGHMMYNRYLDEQPELVVVRPDINDNSVIIKNVKDLIRRATLFTPDQRPIAQEILETLETLKENDSGAKGNQLKSEDQQQKLHEPKDDNKEVASMMVSTGNDGSQLAAILTDNRLSVPDEPDQQPTPTDTQNDTLTPSSTTNHPSEDDEQEDSIPGATERTVKIQTNTVVTESKLMPRKGVDILIKKYSLIACSWSHTAGMVKILINGLHIQKAHTSLGTLSMYFIFIYVVCSCIYAFCRVYA